MASQPRKLFYSEVEAARSLGVSIAQFRQLLQRHIVDSDTDINNAERTTFHAADVMLLRMLLTKQIESSPLIRR